MKHRMIIFILILVLAGTLFFVFNFYKKSDAPFAKDNIPVVVNTLPAQAGLPPEVEAKRQAIYSAVMSRDYEKLNKEIGEEFYYSFGGEYEGGFIAFLKLSESDERESAFDIIPTLLRLPYANRDGLYTWPSFFTVEPSKWTVEDVAMMRTYLTEKQIQEFRDYGGYMYYRIGIKSNGDWVFYLAGD